MLSLWVVGMQGVIVAAFGAWYTSRHRLEQVLAIGGSGGTTMALDKEAIASMRRHRKRQGVLLLGVRQDAILRLAPQLRQETIELVQARNVVAALKLVAGRRFDLVVVRHPVVGMPIDEMLTRLRRTDSRSSQAYVLVLAESASREGLKELPDRQTRVTDSSDFDVILAVVARRILGVARRAETGLMVRIGLWVEGAEVSHFCQIANLSESGMLVRTGDRPPVDEIVEVSFSLPDAPQPIHSKASVVRHASRREVDGVALRFVDLARDARARIRSHVESSPEFCAG